MKRVENLKRLAVAVAGSGLLAVCAAGGLYAAPQSAGATPTVLITGSNRGIGLEFVRQYVARGWHVLATCRGPGSAAELQAIAAKNPDLVTIDRLDVLDFPAVDALSEKYKNTPVDVLINNAGIGGGAMNQALGRMDYAVFEKVLRTNTVAPLKIAEAFMHQVKASRLKKIVTISSSEGSIGLVRAPRLYFYRSSKAAVNMVMKNLALQVKGRGISVALLNPGPTDTDFMKGVPMKLRRPEDAVRDMIGLIDRLSVETTGSFWQYDGSTLPW